MAQRRPKRGPRGVQEGSKRIPEEPQVGTWNQLGSQPLPGIFRDPSQRFRERLWGAVEPSSGLLERKVFELRFVTQNGSHKYRHTYTHTYIHTDIHTYLHTYIHSYIHTCMHTYIHIHTLHTYTHTYITYITLHACMHAYIHTYIHRYMHAYIRAKNIYMHSRRLHRLQTCMHTYIYT